MTTLRDIVTDAMRESGLVQIGVPIEAEQLDEGLRRLQSLILSFYGNEMGSPLTPLVYGREGIVQAYASVYDASNYLSSYFVPPNSQLMVNSDIDYIVYLNPNPQDGERISVVDVGKNFSTHSFTLNGNGRRIDEDRELSLVTDGTNRSWMYRADLGRWVEVTALTASSESPFPGEFDDFLITSLAMRLHPRYQQQTAPETLQAYKRSKSQFRARYRQTKVVYPDLALVRLASRSPYTTGFEGFSPDGGFANGDVILDGGGATP